MPTAQNDVLIEVTEGLINRTLAIAFYTSAIPTAAEGRYRLGEVLSRKDPGLGFIGDLEFALAILEPPVVDALTDESVRLLVRVRLRLSMIEGLGTVVHATVGVTATPTLSADRSSVILDLTQAQIDEVVFQRATQVPARTRKAANAVIRQVLTTSVLDSLEQLDLTPFLKVLRAPNPLAGVDAFVRRADGTLHALAGEFDHALDLATRAVTGAGSRVGDSWPGVWAQGVDASLQLRDGTTYFFRDDRYVRISPGAVIVDPGYVPPSSPTIGAGWEGIWRDGVDAALCYPDGRVFFFRGDEYARFDMAANAGKGRIDDGYPKPIAEGWPGLWADRVDAAFLWDDSTVYFFRGDEVMAFDVAADRAVGPAKPINDVFPGACEASWPLPVAAQSLRVIDGRTLAIGVDLFEPATSRPAAVTDLTDGADLWVSVSEPTIQRCFTEAWARIPSHGTRRNWNTSFSSDEIWEMFWAKALGVDASKLGDLKKVLPGPPTVSGYVSATVRAPRPGLMLGVGEVTLLDLGATVHIAARATVRVPTLTLEQKAHLSLVLGPLAFFDLPGAGEDFELLDVDHRIPVSFSHVTTKMWGGLNEGLRVRAVDLSIERFDLTGVTPIDWVNTKILDAVAGFLIDWSPEIVLLPALVSREVPIPALRKTVKLKGQPLEIRVEDWVVPPDLTLAVTPGVTTITAGSFAAGAGIDVTDLPRTTVSLPLFVANRNPRRTEVHRVGCRHVESIDQYYRVGYYTLIDAVRDGFDGCRDCIPEYHSR